MLEIETCNWCALVPLPIENLPERLQRGSDYFNREYFFEAHDVFEELWMEAREAETRELFHGLVNIATGFYHYRMHNLAGMQSQLRKGAARLRALPKCCQGVAVEHLLEQVVPFMDAMGTNMPFPPRMPFITLYNEISPASNSEDT